jgi:ribonucleotide reductase alpha subunit
MEVINQTGEVIKSGGGRRTALMMCLAYNHGDINGVLAQEVQQSGIRRRRKPQEAITSAFPYLPVSGEAMMEVAFADGIPEDADIIESVLRPLIKHQKDQTLKNANISVLVDQQFFDAVENDEDIEVVWRGNTVTSYPAKEVWDLIDSECLGVRRTRNLEHWSCQ